MRTDRTLLASCAILLAACTAHVGENPLRPGDDADVALEDGATFLRRLTATEYNNALRDVLGDTRRPLTRAAPVEHAFDNNASAFAVSAADVEQYLQLAEDVAARADLVRLAGCADATRQCARSLVERAADRLRRQPLEPSERDDYLAQYDELEATDGHDVAARALLARLLIAPDFLYTLEIGRDDGAVTPRELAWRLSTLLWESVPDESLLAAAESGALSASTIDAHVDRMSADPRAADARFRFYAQWLDLDRLDGAPRNVEGFDAARGDFVEGIRRYLEDAIERDATVPELYRGDAFHVSARMAPLFGAQASDWTTLSLPAGRGAGLLTQPGVMATYGKANTSAPVLRGVFIRERVLCAPLPPPPPGANQPEQLPAARTTRELYTALTSGPTCQGCHRAINPLGFAFEHLDGIGRWREDEGGVAIDASGEIDVTDASGAFRDAGELFALLSDSEVVERCMATQWLRYAFQRSDSVGDQPSVEAILVAHRERGSTVAALPHAVASVAAFHRVHYRAEESQ